MAEFGSGGFNLDGLNFLVDRFGKEGKQKRALTSKMTEEQMQAMEMFAQQNPGMNSAMLPMLQAQQNMGLTKAQVGGVAANTAAQVQQTDQSGQEFKALGGLTPAGVSAKSSQQNANTAASQFGLEEMLAKSGMSDAKNLGYNTLQGAGLGLDDANRKDARVSTEKFNSTAMNSDNAKTILSFAGSEQDPVKKQAMVRAGYKMLGLDLPDGPNLGVIAANKLKQEKAEKSFRERGFGAENEPPEYKAPPKRFRSPQIFNSPEQIREQMPQPVQSNFQTGLKPTDLQQNQVPYAQRMQEEAGGFGPALPPGMTLQDVIKLISELKVGGK